MRNLDLALLFLFSVAISSRVKAYTGKYSLCVNRHSSRKLFSFALPATLSETLGLNDRFDRWRFLQNLLEGDVDNEDANRVLLQVLKKSLEREEGDPEENGTAEITPETRGTIESVITSRKGPLVAFESLEELEQLVPDQTEDEDAFKSTWDSVIEIHGRESVKFAEKEGSARWKLSCLVARVLIHYDFLLFGL